MKRILKFILISIGIFVLLEVSLRIAFRDKLGLRKMPLIYEPDSVIGHRYIPNATSVIKSPSINKEVHINSHGFHGKDFKTAKEPGTFRIVFAGNSDVTGIFTNGPNGYSTFLQTKFDSAKTKVEVINCAIDGQGRYFMDHHNIKSVIVKYEPDLILLETPTYFPFEKAFVFRKLYKDYVIYYLDQAGLDKTTNFIEDNFYGINGFTLTYDMLYSFRYFCKVYSEQENEFANRVGDWLSLNKSTVEWYIKKRVFDKDQREITSVQTSVDSLMSLKNFLANRDINFVMYTTYNKGEASVYGKLLKQLGIHYIDLNIMGNPSYSMEHDGHSSQIGHKVIADKLYASLNKAYLATATGSVHFSARETFNTANLAGNGQKAYADFVEYVQSNTKTEPFVKARNNHSSVNKVLILHGKQTFENNFGSLLRGLVKERQDNITVDLAPDLNSADIDMHKEYIVQQIQKHTPSVVFIEEPSEEMITLENGFYGLYDAMKKYYGQQGISLVFYNFYNDERSAMTQYFLAPTNIEYFQSGLEFNSWEWLSNDEQRLVRLNNYLMAEKFYSLLKKSFVAPEFYSTLKNVALFKPTQASHSLNEWGWHSNTAVDGLRTSYWLSRGYLSLSRLDSVSHEEWYVVDLLKEYELQKIVISPAYDVEYVDLPPDFTFETSRDSVLWETALTVKDYRRTGSDISRFSFKPVHGRYVKFDASKLRTNYYYGKKAFYRFCFAEIEVLGTELSNDQIVRR